MYGEISELFTNAGAADFAKLPDEKPVRAKFALLFRDFNSYLEAAKVQGFQWTKKEYEFCDEAGRKTGDHVIMSFNENDFLTLAQRYKELASSASDEPGGHEDMMYDLSGYLVEIDTGVIDADYMNSRFVKYLKMIRQQGTPGELIEQAKAELHKTFATLTQEEQKYANIFLHDTERGDVIPELKICDMNRIAYQQLLNDYAEYHERQTTMDFHHQLNAYAACFAGSEGPGQLGLFYSSGRKDRDAFFGGTCPDPEGF